MLKDKVKYYLEEIEKVFPNAGCELNYNNIYELLIAVSLSAQTTDKAVNKVTPILFSKYPSIFELKDASQTDVENIIKVIGMSKTKSANIIKLANQVYTDYLGEIPSDLENLMRLSGVGRKTANVVLTEGYKIPRLPVDTHVERVSKRLGIVRDDATVLEVEETLMNLIDESKWHKAHHLLLFMGRYLCLAKKPKCSECFNKESCKYDKKTL